MNKECHQIYSLDVGLLFWSMVFCFPLYSEVVSWVDIYMKKDNSSRVLHDAEKVTGI